MQNVVKIKIYSGLSLTENEVKEIIPHAQFSEPIERWDLEKDIAEGVSVVGIIDGKFGQVLPVVPGEIMDALRAGVCVYGSSSMGALRAAELYHFGMIGVGEIFEHIKASLAFRDDYLGQLILSDADKNHSLTYIDFYFNARTLVKRGTLAPRVLKRIEKLYGELHFSERSVFALRQVLDDAFSKEPQVRKHLLRAATTMGSQKRRDGINLLEKISKDLIAIHTLNDKLHKSVENVKSGAFEPYWNGGDRALQKREAE